MNTHYKIRTAVRASVLTAVLTGLLLGAPAIAFADTTPTPSHIGTNPNQTSRALPPRPPLPASEASGPVENTEPPAIPALQGRRDSIQRSKRAVRLPRPVSGNTNG